MVCPRHVTEITVGSRRWYRIRSQRYLNTVKIYGLIPEVSVSGTCRSSLGLVHPSLGQQTRRRVGSYSMYIEAFSNQLKRNGCHHVLESFALRQIKYFQLVVDCEVSLADILRWDAGSSCRRRHAEDPALVDTFQLCGRQLVRLLWPIRGATYWPFVLVVDALIMTGVVTWHLASWLIHYRDCIVILRMALHHASDKLFIYLDWYSLSTI